MNRPQSNRSPVREAARQPGGKPPAPPIVRYEKVKAACGHEVDPGAAVIYR